MPSTVDATSLDDMHDVALASLHDAGLMDGEEIVLEPLAGGVSNDVVVARTPARGLVVKRALPRLRVAEVWEASTDRSFTEASALEWAATVAPEAVPQVFATDRQRDTIILELAPESFGNWKQLLLSGDVRPQIGARLGQLLAAWHVASAGNSGLLAEFDDIEAFTQLRTDPFYEVAAERNPDVADVVRGLVERMSGTRTALVHGDFSPKNILVDAAPSSELWVIDWEVAHAGDPIFDVAFLLHHLVCKMIASPGDRTALAATAEAFVGSYRDGAGGPFDELYLLHHIAALVLARVDGKSPVDYFTPEDRTRARAHALALLTSRSTDLSESWSPQA